MLWLVARSRVGTFRLEKVPPLCLWRRKDGVFLLNLLFRFRGSRLDSRFELEIAHCIVRAAVRPCVAGFCFWEIADRAWIFSVSGCQFLSFHR